MQKVKFIFEERIRLPPGNSPYNSGLASLLLPIGGTANGIPRNCSTSVPNGDSTTCPLMTPCCVGTSTTSCPEIYKNTSIFYCPIRIIKTFINLQLQRFWFLRY